jgi:hypothetical protein
MKKTVITSVIIVLLLLSGGCNALLQMPEFLSDSPVFYPDSGVFDQTVDITLSATTPGATVYYTTDGSDPDTGSNGVPGLPGANVSAANSIVKAYTVKFGYQDSAVTSGYYYTYHDAYGFGAGDDELVTSLAIRNATGDLYITGQFRGTTDLDPGPGADSMASVGGYDLFVSVLDSNMEYQWGYSLGSSEPDTSRAVAVDSSGNAFITGQLYKDPTVQKEVFIASISASGLKWTKFSGGSGDDSGTSLVIGANGALYYAGTFTGTADLDPRENDELYRTASGDNDICLTRLDDISTVGTFTWSIALGGTGTEEFNGLAGDGSSNLFCGGSFTGITDIDPSSDSGDHASSGGRDALIASYDQNGAWRWSVSFGGYGDDAVTSVCLDAAGNTYACGTFSGTVDFDPGTGTSIGTARGGLDMFVVSFDPAGDFRWYHTMGGSGDDVPASIAVSDGDVVVVSGTFTGVLGSTSQAGAVQLRSSGGTDQFIATVYNDGSYGSVNVCGNVYDDTGTSVVINASGIVTTGGSFVKSVDANAGPGSDQVVSAGMADGLITRYRVQ